MLPRVLEDGSKGGVRVFKHARATRSTPRVIRMRFKNYLVDREGDIYYGGGGDGEKKKVRFSEVAKRAKGKSRSPSGGAGNRGEGSHLKRRSSSEGEGTSEDDEMGDEFDEFGPSSWIEPEHLSERIFLTYKGGFMNKTKKRLDLSLLKSVRKGVQTEVCSERAVRTKTRSEATRIFASTSSLRSSWVA